jgi:competence protein ComGC
LKVGRVQRGKKKKEKAFCELESLISLLAIFYLLIFLCTSKMISQAQGNAAITF